MRLPTHISLMIEHNPHVPGYLTVQEYELLHQGVCEWLDDEQREEANKTQQFWTAQWYPDNPIGFQVVWACDLDSLLAALEAAP